MRCSQVEAFGSIIREPTAGFLLKSVVLLTAVILAVYGFGLMGNVVQ
jgi:hypothetical protein